MSCSVAGTWRCVLVLGWSPPPAMHGHLTALDQPQRFSDPLQVLVQQAVVRVASQQPTLTLNLARRHVMTAAL